MSQEIKTVPADLESEVQKKSVFNGYFKNKNLRVVIGSALALVLVASAAYVGFTGKTGFLKGSILDEYTQQSSITVDPVFSEIFIGETDDLRANKLLINISYDLPGSFFDNVVIGEVTPRSNSFAPAGDTAVVETTPVKGATPTKPTADSSESIISNVTPANTIGMGPRLTAQACIHDGDVDAGETDVPEGKFLKCYALSSDYKTADPVDELLVLNIDDIADQLNGSYALTVFITSDENEGYAIGASTISTTTTPPTYYELRPSAATAPFFDPFDIERESKLTPSQVEALTSFAYGASYKTTRVDDETDVNYAEIPGFIIDGTHSDPIAFVSSLYSAGLYDVGIDVNFDLTGEGSGSDSERVLRLESDTEQIEVRAPSDEDPSAYCSAVTVVMDDAFQADAVVGTEIYQKYRITNSSDTDLNIGLVSDDTDSVFGFTNIDRTDNLTSIAIPADSNGIINVSLLPTAAQTYTSTISFVPRNEITGFSCEPITVNATKTIVSVSGDDEVRSCNLETSSTVYNPETQTVNFLVNSTGSRSGIDAGFRVTVKNSSNDVVATLNQRNVALPVVRYNPSNGNLDWDAEDIHGIVLPDGTYSAELIVSIEGAPESCTSTERFVFDKRTNNEVIVTNNNEPLIVFEDYRNRYDDLYGSPYFERTQYYSPPEPNNPGLPAIPSGNNAPVTNQQANLGFNAGATSIAGDTGPGALLYPFLFMGSALIARRRKK